MRMVGGQDVVNAVVRCLPFLLPATYLANSTGSFPDACIYRDSVLTLLPLFPPPYSTWTCLLYFDRYAPDGWWTVCLVTWFHLPRRRARAHWLLWTFWLRWTNAGWPLRPFITPPSNACFSLARHNYAFCALLCFRFVNQHRTRNGRQHLSTLWRPTGA